MNSSYVILLAVSGYRNTFRRQNEFLQIHIIFFIYVFIYIIHIAIYGIHVTNWLGYIYTFSCFVLKYILYLITHSLTLKGSGCTTLEPSIVFTTRKEIEPYERMHIDNTVTWLITWYFNSLIVFDWFHNPRKTMHTIGIINGKSILHSWL